MDRSISGGVTAFVLLVSACSTEKSGYELFSREYGADMEKLREAQQQMAPLRKAFDTASDVEKTLAMASLYKACANGARASSSIGNNSFQAYVDEAGGASFDKIFAVHKAASQLNSELDRCEKKAHDDRRLPDPAECLPGCLKNWDVLKSAAVDLSAGAKSVGVAIASPE